MRVPTRRSEKLIRVKSDFFITRRKLKELQDTLGRLRSALPGAIAEVERLAQMGDFSENAAYQMAKGRLRGINQKILELEHQISHAQIIETNSGNDTVELGSTVTVEVGGREKTFQILGSTETNPASGVISRHSPIGAALLGKQVGDVITVQLTNRMVDYKVVKIK